MEYLMFIPAAVVCYLGVNKKIPVELAMGLYGGLAFLFGYLIGIKL